MGRRAGRSPEDTRRAILDAFAVSLVERGRSTSLADIARAADVTKGGLLYHFGSKDDLLLALAHDCNDVWERTWLAQVDPDDTEPGRLLRAYVRASFVTETPEGAEFMQPSVMDTLMNDPAAAEVLRGFSAAVDERLADDGLPTDVVDVVVAAADGVMVQSTWGAELPPERSRRLEERLLDLTRRSEAR